MARVAFHDLGDGTQVLTRPCRVCGVLLEPQYPLIEITAFGSPGPEYVMRCPTPRCGEVCRTCRREPGDVHGPYCWEHMRDKLERPHIVDRSDCR